LLLKAAKIVMSCKWNFK